MTRFFNYIVFSNLYISLCASCLFTFFALKSEYNLPLTNILFVFCITYLGYHFIRFIPYKRGFFIEACYKEFYEAKSPLLLIITFIIPIIGALLTVDQVTNYGLWVLLMSSLAFGTYENILTERFNLRSIPYLKTTIIALVWTLICVCLNGPPNFIDLIDCFTFVFLLSIPFDYKDRQSDTQQGVKTIATYLGEKTPQVLSIIFTVYSSIFFYLTGELFFTIAPPLYAILFHLKKKDHLTFHLGFDGIILLRCLFNFY